MKFPPPNNRYYRIINNELYLSEDALKYMKNATNDPDIKAKIQFILDTVYTHKLS